MANSDERQRRIALVIGIGHYEHYPALEFAPPSAGDVFDLLISPQLGHCDPQLSLKRIISGEQTFSPSDLDGLLRQALKHIRPGDQFVFYFCGHGKIHGSDLHLILPNSQTNQPLDNYNFRALVGHLQDSGIQKAILLVDACHSAAMFNSIKHLMGSDVAPELPKGFGFMAASGKFQYARQHPDLKRTIFSHAFCESIRQWPATHEEQITLSALKEAINSYVQTQHPDADQTVHLSAIHEARDALWVSLNPSYSKGHNMINFQQQLSSIARLLQLGEYTIAANECVKLIEQALRQIVTQSRKSLDEETLKKLEESVQKRDRRQEGLAGLTMGQLVHVIQESNFFNAWSRVSGKDLSGFFRILDLHKLTQLRNNLTHHAHEQAAGDTEAQWLFNTLKLILETFELVKPVPETVPETETKMPEQKPPTEAATRTQPQETTIQPPQPQVTNTTTIGSVTGQVHTGSGDIHVQNFSVGTSGPSQESFFTVLQELQKAIHEARSKGLSEDTADDAEIELDAVRKESEKAQPKVERIIKRLNNLRDVLQEAGVSSLMPLVDRTIEAARDSFT